MSRFSAVTVVLFDAVGTILKPDPPPAVVYHNIGQRFGSRRSIDEVQARFAQAMARQNQQDAELFDHCVSEEHERRRWQAIVAETLDDAPDAEQLFLSLWNHFACPDNWALYDDVAPALAVLAERGLRLGIASNFDARLEPICRRHAPLAVCGRPFVSSLLGHRKPSPRFFGAIQQALGIDDPAEILMVGDDLENDVAAARRVGWQALHLDRAAVASSGECVNCLGDVNRQIVVDCEHF